jgi:cyclophilin family peptidyl-prolyl cis-trans isomerase
MLGVRVDVNRWLQHWDLNRRATFAVVAAAFVAIAGCSSNNNKNNNVSNTSQQGTPVSAAARSTPAPNRGFDKAPAFTIDPNKGYLATVTTDKGQFVVELNAQAAPLTVNNFVFLARQHFYDGLPCHRVISGFVAQCGDPKGDGTGGPGYSIPDEKSALKHDTGAIAMAKAGPNTAGSQFYITLAPQPSLDGNYTVFGQVVSGMDVVMNLTPRNPQDPSSASITPSKITSIAIMETDTTPTPVAAAPAASPAAPRPASPTPVR